MHFWHENHCMSSASMISHSVLPCYLWDSQTDNMHADGQHACMISFQQSKILSCMRDIISMRDNNGGGGLPTSTTKDHQDYSVPLHVAACHGMLRHAAACCGMPQTPTNSLKNPMLRHNAACFNRWCLNAGCAEDSLRWGYNPLD